MQFSDYWVMLTGIQEVNVPVHNYESMETTDSQTSLTSTSGTESYVNGTSVVGQFCSCHSTCLDKIATFDC